MMHDPYFWLKSVHLIFMVAWIAGLLIYPRYKLHQIKSAPGEALFDTMMESSNLLRKIILTPSILVVWAAGLAMIALNPVILTGTGSGWLHAKLLLLLGISGLHGYFIAMGKKIDAGTSPSSKSLKMLNEVPFILMAIIILLAVLRPF